MSAVTSKKASADWVGLCRIYVELDDPNHPLRCVPFNREAAIANAVGVAASQCAGIDASTGVLAMHSSGSTTS